MIYIIYYKYYNFFNNYVNIIQLYLPKKYAGIRAAGTSRTEQKAGRRHGRDQRSRSACFCRNFGNAACRFPPVRKIIGCFFLTDGSLSPGTIWQCLRPAPPEPAGCMEAVWFPYWSCILPDVRKIPELLPDPDTDLHGF